VDVWVLPATPGETMLACSDGLTNEVDDQTIAATLADGLDPQAAADALCKMAVENGGHDNVSVVIARLSA
jgi:protein phosphatase